MTQLTQEFINSCPLKKGFHLRGESMTRIEVFVDAAFAFAVTMLVISLDEIPTNVDELITAFKQIPAFVVCVAQLVWIWHTHAVWSHRYGFDDGKTVVLSVTLLIIVLIYIYPLKIVFSGFLHWISASALPTQFIINGFNDLRFLFVFFAVGFTAIWLTFLAMYHHALSKKTELLLTDYEIFRTTTQVQLCIAMAIIGVFASVAPFMVADRWVPITGFVYMLIGIAIPTIEIRRAKLWQKNLPEFK